jgi:pimeloyl-ACP methyl ester carboxylesterase
MKTIKNTFKIVFSLTIILLSTQAFSQCDSCDFKHELNPYTDIASDFPEIPDNTVSLYTACPATDTIRKNISFIHGLGGSIASWARQVEWTDEHYQTGVENTDYTASHYEQSFHSVALKVKTDLAANGTDALYPNRCKLNDFAIAHSQGGIVARFLDWQWATNTNSTFGNRTFHGLVTFGTPHAGADIALSRDLHSAYVQKAVSTVLLKDLNNVVYDLTDRYGHLFGRSASDILNNLDSIVKNQLNPLMLASTVHTNTLDEMAPGTDLMNELNNYDSKLHKVTFYGVEDDPECWRVMDNIATKASEDYDLFSAGSDETFMDKMENVRASHISSIESNKKKISKLMGNGFLIENYWTQDAQLAKVRTLQANNKHRKKAVDFLNNANSEWRYLIGSYHPDSNRSITTTQYIARVEYKFGNSVIHSFQKAFDSQAASETWAEKFLDHEGAYTVDIGYSTKTSTVSERIFYPSDGVVLVRSQVAFKGAPQGEVFMMPGSNHFQERNDENTKEKLENLYDGEYNDYFLTLEKL